MWIDSSRHYDIIGDVHGCAQALEQLLALMGYRKLGGVWQHPQRMAVFLGDIIDRGPQIRQSLELVYLMVEQGHAHCLMGNHEYYALAWHTPTASGFVRDHNDRHASLWQATAEQFASHAADWRSYLDWFASLPLFLENQRCRMVHACWDDELISAVREQFAGSRVDLDFVRASAVRDSFEHRVFNRLLRGINLRLPDGQSIQGQDGLTRGFFRAKFWEEEQPPQTWSELAFQPDPLPAATANQPLPAGYYQQLIRHGRDNPMLFVGHYWRDGQPGPILPNLACLDYSAVNGGRLVAYRLGDEQRINPDNFVWVETGHGEPT